MEIIYLLIPLSLVLVVAAIWAFSWAAKSGQFDDLDSPALTILDDDSFDSIDPHKPNRGDSAE
ncbi:cbb3-type cytochrome oxidase assembly protein CcoS [Arenicella xantha]|uniref:Cbb3-type cytochrome oxidase maturation protein n=1 Tax=Arenicella xantha TaxID=644221 RepID=A0A395JM59_9GAMM|nr:cbb3-type cytochrome oxidase assembly protein CcoS [Arenicella xantha]RBP50694.1 cbb3-type cytochrome oxidase maturation protein [Arenicella xantha]